MKTDLVTKKLKLKLITPVVIGSGKTLDGYAYIVGRVNAFIVDLYKFLKTVDASAQKKLLSALERDIMQFRKELQNFKQQIIEQELFTDTIELTKPVLNLIEEKIPASQQTNQLLVDLLPRTFKKPFLPGSSIFSKSRPTAPFSAALPAAISPPAPAPITITCLSFMSKG
jgi:CRISPR/Cas system CSM-associated protein Csm5 (group 7 of RAMP superfamily)